MQLAQSRYTASMENTQSSEDERIIGLEMKISYLEDFVRQLVPVAFTQEDIMPLELPGNGVIATGDGDNVNVRSFPGTGSESQVVGQLSQGTDVAIVATTARPQVIDGVEAPWYQVRAHLEDGSLVEGWIFGGYLEQ